MLEWFSSVLTFGLYKNLKIICILMVQHCTETYLFVFSVLMHIEIGMGIVFLFGHVAGHNEETRDDEV